MGEFSTSCSKIVYIVSHDNMPGVKQHLIIKFYQHNAQLLH